MNELLFPTLGTAVMFLVVLPLCALASKLVLVVVDRVGRGRLVHWGAGRYVLLVAPSFLPLLWGLSAGLHQAETGRSVIACLVSHDIEQLCVEPLLFATLLSVVLVARALPWVRSPLLVLRPRGVTTGAEVDRVKRLIGAHPALQPLAGRTLVSKASIGGTATVGIWRPTVLLDADFVKRCDDEALVGALAHELEHVRHRDPLRYLLLFLAMRVNPLGERLLRPHVRAWTFSREVQCDRAAVLGGVEPFGIARAIVNASRPAHHALAHIRGGGAEKLQLRVELLLAYAEKRPVNDATHGASALAWVCCLTLLSLTVPHGGGTDPLDLLHTSVERAARALLN